MRWKAAIERFLDNIEPVTESGCWIWIGSTIKAGYGRFNWENRDSYAHIFSYEFHGRSIPNGYEVDHLCRVRCCVNPHHLEAVTPRVNKLRSNSPQAINAAKAFCPSGHEYSYINTYVRPVGDRQCRICIRLRLKTKRLRLKGGLVS